MDTDELNRGGDGLGAPVPLAAERGTALATLAKLDRRLAYVVTCTPPAGFIVAMVLVACGQPVGPVPIGLWLGMHILALVGVEVGFHRHFSHRSFNAHPRVRALLAILGSLAFQGPVIWWAATHRRHHCYSDHPGDPHSPNLSGKGAGGLIRGLFHAHMGWLFVAESTRAPGWDQYARDLYRDEAIFKIHVRYFFYLLLGFAVPAILGGLLTWSLTGALLGFLWGGLVRVFIMNHIFYWCINSVTHAFGTRPFKSDDLSTNNLWISIPTLGQAWHNNHHAFPWSALMSMKWWQIDPGGWVIRALEKLGLVWDVRSPTPAMIAARLKGSPEEGGMSPSHQ